MSDTVILWKHLDGDGRDFCRLRRDEEGWLIHGHAVFLHDRSPASLSYRVTATPGWHTIAAQVTGWIGADEIDIRIAQAGDGTWLLDGERQDVAPGIVDLDLGFTPATNLLPLRRLSLDIGARADAPAAYFDLSERGLSVLEQSYRRLDVESYAYAAPAFGYEAVLTVDATGFVRRYPDLFEAVTTPLPGR